MAGSGFARAQLEKHGWTEGSGLGQAEDGIKEAIKVQIKNDKTGVGHDPGQEFKFHWWDHVFNKAASNISVKNTEDGVDVTTETSSGNISNKKPVTTKTLDNKALLYGRFIKASTISFEGTGMKEVREVEEPSSDDEEEEKADLSGKHTDEELFKLCGGRTAHKGARHGHKMNGKLARIMQQETSYGSSQNASPASSETDESSSKKKKKKKKNKRKSEESAEQVEENKDVAMTTTENNDLDKNSQEEQTSETDCIVEKKKKKKKSKKSTRVKESDDLVVVEEDSVTIATNETNHDSDLKTDKVKKHKKSKKRKREEKEQSIEEKKVETSPSKKKKKKKNKGQ